jgi:hypothetical protein
LNPVDPQLESAWFHQPLNLQSDILVSNFACLKFNLYRYDKVIVVRRNEQDNIAANLRFFQKTRPDCAISLNQSAYFHLFAAREKLVYEHWHCGWQRWGRYKCVVLLYKKSVLFYCKIFSATRCSMETE